VFLFKILRRIFTAIFLLIIIVPLYIASQIWWTAHHPVIKASDAIVVLGAAQDNGKPTPVLALLITVGGSQKGDLYTEAAASRNELISEGTPRWKVVAIPMGKDTLTSTLAYVTYMKLHHLTSVILATDPYHCYRAIAEAKGQGISATCAQSKNGPGSLKSTGARYIFREMSAYIAYETVGRFGIHLTDQIKK
jgi:hypothetical protein